MDLFPHTDCRTSSRRRDGLTLTTEKRDTDDAFALADTDNAGNITLAKYLAYVNVEGEPKMYTDWFAK